MYLEIMQRIKEQCTCGSFSHGKAVDHRSAIPQPRGTASDSVITPVAPEITTCLSYSQSYCASKPYLSCTRATAMASFAHLWKGDLLSDVDVAVRVDGSADDILVVPAHQTILSFSPYFWAQVQRWTTHGAGTPENDTVKREAGSETLGKRTRASCESSSAGSSMPNTHEPPKRPRLQLVLNSHEAVSAADQAAAAESVLAAMYDPTGSSNLAALDKLTDTQLLQAAIIADMVQLDETSAQAAGLLAKSTELSAAVKQQYMSLPAWPQQLLPLFPAMAAGHPLLEVCNTWVTHCASAADGSPLQGPSLEVSKLLQLPLAYEMQAVLVQQLGELDRVWADEQLSQLLLWLPLPAMVLLLSSEGLKVSSEDNVLYTAQAWFQRQTTADQRAAAAQCLAPCIRCLQLSQLWLSALALSADLEGGLMCAYISAIRELHSLVLLKSFTPEQVGRYAAQLKEDCPSWFLPPRQYTRLPAGGGGVEVQWSLPVSELREACRAAHAGGEDKLIPCEHQTPPLKGVRWAMKVFCAPEADSSGVTVGLYTSPVNIPKGVYCQYRYSSNIAAHPAVHNPKCVPITSTESEGKPDNVVGAMAGGWDAAAWADQGLPTDGDLLLKLKVYDVWP